MALKKILTKLFFGLSVGGASTLSSVAFADLTDKKPGDVIFIDVRTPSEFQQGHIPGSLNIDLYDSSFLKRLGGLDREKTYKLYCRSGARSGQALSIMRTLGFLRAENIGGFRQASRYASQLFEALPQLRAE